MGIFKLVAFLFFSQAMGDAEHKPFYVFTAESKSYELTLIICLHYEQYFQYKSSVSISQACHSSNINIGNTSFGLTRTGTIFG